MCCLMFSQTVNSSKLMQPYGFNHWKAPERIVQHKKSTNHRQCFTQWKEAKRNITSNQGTIDAELQLQI